MDQHDKYSKMGIATLFLAEGYNVDSIDHVIKGQYQLLFISPEFLLKNQQMRNILLSDVYQTNLVCVTIDEAHCVLMWYVPIIKCSYI
jgi:superfamily II DNA helicase RecQ